MNTTSSGGGDEGALGSLTYYRSLRKNETGTLKSIRREENEKVDWIETSEGEQIGICHIESISGLTAFGGPEINGYQEQAALLLALQHLNAGDASIVPELEGLNERCPIRFTFETNDNVWNPAITTQAAIDALARPEASLEELRPCAFYGARASPNTAPMASFLGINDFVQVTGLAFSPVLNDREQFPLVARTYPPHDGIYTAMSSLLVNQLNVKHLAILNANTQVGNRYVDAMQSVIADQGLDLKILQIPYDEDDPENIRRALQTFKDSEYRYVYVANGGYRPDIFVIADLAQEMGLSGTSDYFWFLEWAIQELITDRPLLKDSGQHWLYRGHANIGMIDNGNPSTVLFRESVASMKNPSDLAYFNSLWQPIWEPNLDNPSYMARAAPIENGQFIDNLMDETLSGSVTTEAIVYDAVIALGLATCEAYLQYGPTFTGRQQHDTLLQRPAFGGASGPVQFRSDIAMRDPSTFTYGIFTTYEKEYNATHVTIERQLAQFRVDEEWQVVSNFFVGDRDTNLPLELPPVKLDENVVSPAIRGVVLSMFGVVLLLVTGFSYWTFKNIGQRVVVASQPFFLFTLLSGISILAAAIVPISFDHTVATLDGAAVACNSTLWLLSIGFCVTFSALFTKNYRINRILKESKRMRRVQLSIKDSIIPMASLLVGKLPFWDVGGICQVFVGCLKLLLCL